MSKEENVIKFYVLCNKLKKVIRTGWKDWNVEAERLESIAEHIYGVQMLALAMKDQYEYDVDIMKVIMMLAIHELEEIYIGDLTMFQINKEEKKIIGHEAVSKMLENLIEKDRIKELIYEFDERKTNEARFAHLCDKLECDIQSKIYEESGCMTYTNGKLDKRHTEGNNTANHPLVKELLDQGDTWSKMWLEFGQKIYNYDEDFLKVSNYAIEHDITKNDDSDTFKEKVKEVLEKNRLS